MHFGEFYFILLYQVMQKRSKEKRRSVYSKHCASYINKRKINKNEMISLSSSTFKDKIYSFQYYFHLFVSFFSLFIPEELVYRFCNVRQFLFVHLPLNQTINKSMYMFKYESIQLSFNSNHWNINIDTIFITLNISHLEERKYIVNA